MASINAKLLEQKKAFNYHWIGLEHQHGHRDIMCKRSEQCYANSFFFLFLQAGGGGGGGNKGYSKLEYDLPAWDIVVTNKSEMNKCTLGIVTQI